MSAARVLCTLVAVLLLASSCDAHSKLSAALAALKPHTGKITCDLCTTTLYLAQKLAELKTPQDEVLKVVSDICVSANLYTPPVCSAIIVDTFGPVVYQLLLEKICAGFGICNSTEAGLTSIKLPPKPHRPVQRHKQPKRHVTWPTANSPKMPRDPNVGYVLHFSDVHYDDLYVIGGIADCPDPLCCRNVSENGTERALKWGSYHCDIPSPMLDAWFDAITNLPFPLDFIMWTGDNPPHDIWEENRMTQLYRTEYLTDRLYAAFEDPAVTVYPALGNHETYPCDQYHLPEWQWLNNNISNFWSRWIDAESQATVVKGGYYTELIEPGFRLVSLNTQYGDLINFYWILGDLDYGNMTEWLTAVLTEAEANNEKVWIISHIPVMVQAQVIDAWSDQFAAIFSRFSDTITGIFAGHTHNDQYVTIVDENNNPTAVQWIIPSVTTFVGINPSFRVWAYDRTTFEVLDYQQWNTNLTLANIDDNATFAPWYSAVEYYGLDDMSAGSWQNLFYRMQGNETLAQKWVTAFNTNAPADPCTGDCLTLLLCSTQGTNSERSQQCALAAANTDRQ